MMQYTIICLVIAAAASGLEAKATIYWKKLILWLSMDEKIFVTILPYYHCSLVHHEKVSWSFLRNKLHVNNYRNAWVPTRIQY